MLDEEVHQQHRAIGDQYQYGGEGAGDAVGALLGKFVDLHGDQQVAGRHQQYDGGNGRDGSDEGGHQAGEEGILDQRQRDGGEHLQAVRAHVVGRFLDGLVDLPQRGDARAGAGGQRAHHEHDDQYQPRAVDTAEYAGVEQAVGKAADVAYAQHRAGHGHGQYRDRLDEALGLEIALDHQIGDDHGQQRRDRRGDQRKHKGIPESLQALVASKHLLEPLEGQGRELIAPGREQRADGHADVHHDDENRRQRAQGGQRDRDRLVLDQHPGAAGLARQGSGGLALQVVLLNGEHQQRDAQQHHGHRRRALLVHGAGDLQVDRGGQRIVTATDDHRVGEIGDGFDERHQEGVAQAGQQQRQRHRGEHLPAGSAHVPGRLLHGGVDVLQQALHHHVAHREEGQRLHDDDAPVAVDVVVVDAQHEASDQARLAEQHDHRQGKHEGRRHHGQH